MFLTKKGALKKVCAEVETFCGKDPVGEPTGIMPKILPFLYKEKPTLPEKPYNSFNRMILLVAVKEIGVKEVTGSKSNPMVVKYYSYERTKRGSDPINWSSAFVSYCIEKAGLKSIDCNSSIAFKDWGIRSFIPVPGDVIVFENHCGIFVEEKNGLLIVIGANKQNEVCAKGFPFSEVIAIRQAEELTFEQATLLGQELPMIIKAIS
jgi:uncharacterized protein (TIGR02594 family)